MIWRRLFTIPLLAGIMVVSIGLSQNVWAGMGDDSSLFPSWFNNNLQWFLDGQIDEKALADAFTYLADNDIVFLDPDRAMKVKQLQDENEMLKQKIGVGPEDPDIILRPVPGALPELPGFPDACPEIYAPVCGPFGQTFDNECFANQAGVDVLHDGKCEDSPQRECPSGYFWIECAGMCVKHDTDFVCPDGFSWIDSYGQCRPDKNDIHCPDVYQPVCGVNEKTYGNSCEASRDGVEIAHEGECQNECSSNDDCSFGQVCRDSVCQAPCDITCFAPDPVCGTDGNTYACGAPDAACHGVEVAHDGECKADLECTTNIDCSGGNVCRDSICQAACEVQCIVPDPVCGEDGITYVCGAADAQCHGIDVAYEGECTAFRATPAQ